MEPTCSSASTKGKHGKYNVQAIILHEKHKVLKELYDQHQGKRLELNHSNRWKVIDKDTIATIKTATLPPKSMSLYTSRTHLRNKTEDGWSRRAMNL